MAEKIVPKRGNLLIVDDDTNWLKFISTLLSKHFNVSTAKSGPEGLDILRSDFNPGVILSDLNMPIMNGIEFLKEAGKIHPLALKIIISAYANPSEIIAALNQCRAYMYLLKPVDIVQLIQILRNAFDTYNLILKNNQLVEALKKIGVTDLQTISKIKTPAELQKSDIVIKEFISVLRKLFAQAEKYYFTNHSGYVFAISEALAKALKFTDKTLAEILTSASLINIPYLLMPKRFYFYDPYDLDQNEKIFFFSLFSEAISILSKIEAIKVEVDILSQIWENQIGTGGPNGYQGNDVLREAQIISMANIYHNKVYRLQPHQLSQLEIDGVVIQTREETFQRHNEAIKFFYRKANWFDSDIFNTFQSIAKSRSIPEFILPSSTLTIRNFDLRILRTETKLETTSNEEKNEEESIPEVIEREIRAEKLKPGMIVAQNVVTKTGVLIVRQDNKLDEALVENIKYLASQGLVPKEISVYVIPPPHLVQSEGK